MKTFNIKYQFTAYTIVGFIFFASTGSAQLSASLKIKNKLPDTLLRIIDDNYTATITSPKTDKKLSAESISSFESTIESQLDTRVGREKLLEYLKDLSDNNSDELAYNQVKAQGYYKLAGLFAKLRLYPLAMKCFFKTMVYKQKAQHKPDSVMAAQTGLGFNGPALTINAADDSVFVNSPVQLKEKKEKKSKSITYNRILNTFNDGKKAAAYALLFHVKQPKPGKPTVFVRANTGHTFITLIKYNTDSTSVSVSFGFYPVKDNIFSATPWEPETTGGFKNDSDHHWDEVMGKFISERKFQRILKLTQRYEGLEYHLSKNNCTDFALQAASFAGFGVTNSKGSWPLGSGNNPGITGQSIIAGAVYDDDNDDLFINYDEAVK